jgi:hemerythrin-like metal-binding protein
LTSAATLSKLAEGLRQTVGRFKFSDDGSNGADRASFANTTQSGANSGRPDGSFSSNLGSRPFFEWSDDLSVGVEAMDQHHKKLVDLINRLHEAMRSGQGRAVIGPALDELANYTSYHFAAEEKLMEKHRCPGLPEQLEAHRGLIAAVTEARQKLAAGRQGVSLEVLTMLKDWLVNHIQHKDKSCMSAVCATARARGISLGGNGNGHSSRKSGAASGEAMLRRG